MNRNSLHLGTALAALSFGVPQVACAQEAQSAPRVLETVVVTARPAIDTPLELIKRESAAIIDSITAEVIEQTADITLPEALDRVVGVSSDSFYGTSEAGYVSLRGFDSRYNSMDIDGSPVWFSSQNNRGAQMGMFPSAIVKETNVYKTVTPDIDANSIGGHISMRTLRAFDGGTKPFFKAGYRIGFPDRESTVNDGPSDQAYAAGKLTFGPQQRYGFVFGVNRQRTADADDFGSVSGYIQAEGPDGQVHDQINGNVFTDSAYDKTVINTAVFAKLETRIEDRLYAFVSANYFDEDRNMYLQRSGPYIANSGSRTVIQTGPGQADFTNGQGQVREYDYDMQRKAFVLGMGLDYRLFDKASLSLRGNYTDYSNDTLTRNLGSGFRLGGVDGTYDINGDTPIIRPLDTATYNDPQNWAFSNTMNTSGSAAYNRTQPLRDDVYTLGTTFNYNNQASAEGFGASAGIDWVRLDRSFNQDHDYWALNSGTTLTLADVTPEGSTMEGNRAGINSYDAFWDFMYNNGASRHSADLTTDYELREDVLALHGAANYAMGPLRLLAGIRYESTSDTTDTGQMVSGEDMPLYRSNDYDNWLPNVQASYDVTSRLKLRASFTKTIGRPDFSDFAPGTTTTFDANGVTLIKGSNGQLGPRQSTNYDASIEYYLDDGLLAVSVFKKDIADETFNQVTEIYDTAGMLLEIDTIPLNTGGASVQGIELTVAKRRLDFLPAGLDRLGISANYTYLDGQWDVVFTDGSTRTVGGLRNQPEWLANLRVSYDAGPLDFNVNYRARGRTFTGSFGTVAENDRWVRANDRLDLQASYTVSGNLRVRLDAKNVTDSYTIQTIGIEESIYNSVGAGPSFWVGLHYQH